MVPPRKRRGQVIRRKIYGPFKKGEVGTGHQTENLRSIQERGGDRSSDEKSMVPSRKGRWGQVIRPKIYGPFKKEAGTSHQTEYLWSLQEREGGTGHQTENLWSLQERGGGDRSSDGKSMVPSRKRRGQIRRKIYGPFKKGEVRTGHQTENLWSLKERGGGDRSPDGKSMVPSRNRRWGQVIRRKIYGPFKKVDVGTGRQTENLRLSVLQVKLRTGDGSTKK
jgi:hypothetical protein